MWVYTHQVLIFQYIWGFLCLLDYIRDFIKDIQMIEYTKDKWIDQKHQYVL